VLSGRSIEHLQLGAFVDGLTHLAEVGAERVDQATAALIEKVTGFPPVLGEPAARPRPEVQAGAPGDAGSDLQFFRSLALQLESRSPLFKGRTLRVLRLALETNKLAGQPVDPQQLEAAVYLHDFGMMLVPEAVWLKVGKLTPEDKLALRNHPGFAAGLVQRMPGWAGAAEMVAQHHEMPDGGGYPHGLNADAICAGAKILAIVDAFESVMLKHSHRGKNRSVLRAIAEINACDRQFAPEWIEPFNAVIRRTLES